MIEVTKCILFRSLPNGYSTLALWLGRLLQVMSDILCATTIAPIGKSVSDVGLIMATIPSRFTRLFPGFFHDVDQVMISGVCSLSVKGLYCLDL